jgi:hypothetical protein
MQNMQSRIETFRKRCCGSGGAVCILGTVGSKSIRENMTLLLEAPGSLNDQNRAMRVPQHSLRHASQKEPLDPTQPLRTYNDHTSAVLISDSHQFHGGVTHNDRLHVDTKAAFRASKAVGERFRFVGSLFCASRIVISTAR